jgi:hypothetical protein
METRAKTAAVSRLLESRGFLWLLWILGGCLWINSLLHLAVIPLSRSISPNISSPGSQSVETDMWGPILSQSGTQP